MEKDDFVCGSCRMSAVGLDGLCINCGYDKFAMPEEEAEDDDDREEDEEYSDEYDDSSEEDFYAEIDQDRDPFQEDEDY